MCHTLDIMQKRLTNWLNSTSLAQKLLLVFVIGVLEGLLLLSAFRFITYSHSNPHYHANFEIWVEGERVDFEGFRFFQSVLSCSADSQTDPKEKVHMHNDVDDLAHVHADLVTWNNFFSNIDVSVSDSHIQIENDVFLEEGNKKISFYLNGEKLRTLHNVLIDQNDTLLVSLGSETEQQLSQRFESIAKSSIEADENNDPASCGGGHEPSLTDRLKAIYQ